MAESNCGLVHIAIEDAIVHAEMHLGTFRKSMEPYWGTLKDNSSWVVGFQVSSRKRWRLDFDPTKGVHINEENFDAPLNQQRIVHLVDNRNFTQVQVYYQKWTRRYR